MEITCICSVTPRVAFAL